MATPHVTGTVALMEAANESELQPEYTKRVLKSTAVDLGEKSTRQGAGLINTTAAVNAVRPAKNNTEGYEPPENETNTGDGVIINFTDVPNKIDSTNGYGVVNFTVTNNGDTKVTPEKYVNEKRGTIRKLATYPNETREYRWGVIPEKVYGVEVWNVTIVAGGESKSVYIPGPALEVEITDTTITPAEINSTATNYTLAADLHDLSDDGQPDYITIELPEEVNITQVSNTSAVGEDGQPITVVDTTTPATNRLNISVSPDTNAARRNATVTTGFVARVE